MISVAILEHNDRAVGSWLALRESRYPSHAPALSAVQKSSVWRKRNTRPPGLVANLRSLLFRSDLRKE
jgi:hypothetical protein